MSSRKENLMAFLTGLVLGYKALPLGAHLIYVALIALSFCLGGLVL